MTATARDRSGFDSRPVASNLGASLANVKRQFTLDRPGLEFSEGGG